MRFPEPKPQIKRTAGWLGDATSLFFVFICLLPTGLPNTAWGIEASWAQVLQTAFAERLQFGEQIVFTYGPWGFLYGGFQPETRLAGILAWAGLAAILWWVLRCIATASFENNFARWLWIVLVASLTNQIESYTDVRLLCWPLSLLALHIFAEGRNVKIAKGLIIFSLGLIALIKFNLLIQSAIVILWVSADTVWRQRRFPWSLPLYIGSVLFFWLAAGQRLSLLGKFLRVSWEFASSYSEVMTLTGPNESRYIAWFALGALLLTMIFAVAVWQRLRIFFMLPLAAFGLLIFTIFKYGFVRDDNAHQVDASVEMVLIALMCLAFLRPWQRRQKYFLQIASCLPIVMAYVFAEFSCHRFSAPPLIAQLGTTLAEEKFAPPARLLFNQDRFRQNWQDYLADYRRRYPLPPLQSDADYYSWNQLALLAHGVHYRPRPVFQSYSACTPRLAELNAAHLRSEEAPETILFDGFTIDRRYNSLDDGLSWPELWTRYDVHEVEFPFVVLTRSKSPRSILRKPLGTNSINFGEQVLLPDASNAVLWAEMEVKPTLTGSFVSTVFKSPELSLVTTLRNGQVRTNRFVPQMAHAGFVLSPFVKDCTSFATIASADWPSDLAQDAVTAFRIIPTDGHLPVSGYLNSILIRLYQLDFPRQNLEEVPGFHQVTELKEEIRRIKSVQNEKLTYLPDGGSVLAATGNSTVLFSRPPGASRLRLGFGLHSNDSKNTNAVTFVAVGANERGQATLLWSRHLDANSAPGKQDATVEIGSEEISRIALQTVSDHPGTNETFVPYWYQFRFE